ncbi:Ubiquitin hydrolase [Trachipleistophora hominis]|uniref:ubiquitinyl hydrolase 1 n=1 Tax=Trachipleistophora hominis TaxID=72359 RepID=L7JYY5_TRAHO|nr:Ubiquitin hydrolase [Trachipleistophora hominis]
MNKLKLQNTVFPVANAHIKERRLAKLIGKNYNLRSRIYNEKRGTIKLEDCIDLFLSKEYLGLDNRLVCTYCERVTVHSKKYEIVFLPKYLIIQLKRFNFNGDYQRKIKTFVDYHSTLIINAVRYTLRSTCNHIEIGVGSGHYTAYFYGDRIVCANDSVVSEVKDVNKSNAYMLFYERVE